MANKKTRTKESSSKSFIGEMIDDINDEREDALAFSLKDNKAPTIIKYFVPSGSRLLDIAISNVANGGLPGGRLVEIQGTESSGKSLLAQTILKETQKMGNVAVYIDTENATSINLLRAIGLDLNNLVYVQASTVEEVFSAIERIIKMVRKRKDKEQATKKITIVWDSVANTSSEEEINKGYDDTIVGTSAKRIAQGLRKVIDFIGKNDVTLVFVNQLKYKIQPGGMMYGDPYVTPGGKAIPYQSSVRIRLAKIAKIKNAKGEVLGVKIKANIIKNKIAPPHREAEFEIYFDRGIVEGPSVFKVMKQKAEKPIDVKYKGSPAYISFFPAKGKSGYAIEIKDRKGQVLVNPEKVKKADIDSFYLRDKNISYSVNEALAKMLVKQYANENLEDINFDSSQE